MKKLLLSLSLGLVLLPAVAQAGYNEPYCREYTETVAVGNRLQEGYGTACLQPDGAWKIVSEKPQRTVTFTDNVEVVPAVRERFITTRERYRYREPANSFVIGFNVDRGNFFTTSYPRYRDHDRRDWKRDRHHRHDRDHDRGRRGWHD